MVKLLNRYILKETLTPFFLLMLIFTFSIASGNMIKLSDFIINKGVSVSKVLELVTYIIPYLLSFTIPISLLTAVLFAIGRLSADNEITALKACGITLYRIAAPILLLGFLFSLASFYINDTLVSKAHFKMRMLLIDIGYEKPEALLEPGKFIDAFDNYIFYFRDITGVEMEQIIIYEFEHEKTVRTITAKRGVIEKSADEKTITLRLFDGSADEPDPTDPKKFYKLYFKSFPIMLNIDNKEKLIKRNNKRLKEMSLKEILIKIKEMRKKGVNPLRLLTEFHRKISFSFACLILPLIGFSLAVYTGRGEKTIGFGISLFLTLTYYILLMFSISISQNGFLVPKIAMWIPNCLMALIGIIMLIKTARK